MGRKISPSELALPHWVEWGASDDGDYEDYQEKRFIARSEAQDFADEKANKGYAVWLGEAGSYTTEKGGIHEDWIYYWWNQKSSWGETFGRGTGYVYGRNPSMRSLVNYQPLCHL